MLAPAHNLMLSEMAQCAHRLGMGFAAEADRAATEARRLEFFQLFDRCFFSVRVAIALELRLRRAFPGELAAERAAGEAFGGEPPDRADRLDERDRERDREVEPASMPVLLQTLNGVAAEAGALPGPEPAALPTLRELLAQVSSASASKSSTVARPQGAGVRAASGLRARLAGSGALAVTARTPPAVAGPGAALPPRQATGPPRR